MNKWSRSQWLILIAVLWLFYVYYGILMRGLNEGMNWRFWLGTIGFVAVMLAFAARWRKLQRKQTEQREMNGG